MSAHSATADSSGPLTARLFGVVREKQTYRNLLYVILRFPLGIAYFTVFFTGVVVGVVLIPVVIGVPILALTLAGATYAASLEATIARRLLGVDVSYEPRDPAEMPLVPYLKETVTDARSYLFVGYFLAMFGIGVASFVAVTVLFTMAVVLAVAPLTYWLPWTAYRIVTFDGGTVAIDTLPEALVASVVGIALFVASLHVFNLAARGFGTVTRTLFS